MKTAKNTLHFLLAAALVTTFLAAPKAQAGDREGHIVVGALIGGVLGYIASERNDHRGRVTIQAGTRPCGPRPVVVHRPVVVYRPVVIPPRHGHRPVVVVRPGHGRDYRRPQTRYYRKPSHGAHGYEKDHGKPGKGYDKPGKGYGKPGKGYGKPGKGYDKPGKGYSKGHGKH